MGDRHMVDIHALPIISNKDAHGAPLGVYAESNRMQTDIPHLIDFAMRVKQEPDPIVCEERSNDSPYQSRIINSYIDTFTRCSEPSGLCSGSHRIVFQGLFRGTPFVASVEEIEDIWCGYEGELIRIGTTSCIDEIEFLKFLVRSTAGVELYLPTQDRGENYLEKLHFEYVSRESILSQECRLSDIAKRCLLYF